MSSFQPSKVLILASSQEASRRIRTELSDAVEIVQMMDEQDPRDMDFDLIVTDLSADPENRVGAAGGVAENERPKASVLGLGLASREWADVTLPDDYTPRELRLACALLGEVARLRARLHHAARIGLEDRQLANTDPLTNLPNRRAWDSRLEAICARAVSAPFWLAIVDLDRFKPVNDRCGLAVGDAVLKRVAQALAESLRRDDLVARIGGDEFGILLSGIDESAACSVLERLRKAIANLPSTDQAGPLTISIGYTSSTDTTVGGSQLLAAAERGLRRAKQAGGNSVHPGNGVV
jgi:diguanylate cyclase (GGDEF)-like protein